MAISQLTRWDDSGTLPGAGNAKYVAGDQPISEYDNWFNWSAAKDLENLITFVETHATEHVTGGADVIADAIAAGNSGLMTGADKTKLNGVEALADVTDATNVDAAGAAMNSDKDVANGIAGLDANILLSPLLLPPCLEEYSNHLGAVDNFTQVGTTGNGSANEDAANHEMDLSTGLTVVGHARFETKKSFTPAARPIVCNFILQNTVTGAGGARVTHIGLKNDFSNSTVSKLAVFQITTDGSWTVQSRETGGINSDGISTPSDGDILSIVITTSKLLFYVNGVVVAEHSSDLPVSAMKTGASVHVTVSAATTAREAGVSLLSVKRYA